MDSVGENQNQASSLTDSEKKLAFTHPSARRSPSSPSPPFLNKFANNLRRDLLLSNFDRNLTVEQAHFDPNLSLGVSQENSPATGPYTNHSDNSNTDNESNRNPPDATATNAPSPPPGPIPPSEPHHLSRRTSNSKLDAKRKQAKRSPMHSTATPSEYFHRNLVDAVSNVEDSDENEYFVYPYSGNDYHSNSPIDCSSTPRSPLGSKKSHTGTLRSSLSSHELNDSVTSTKPRRPKLRSYVMDPHSTKKEYGSMKGSQSRFLDGQLLPKRHSSSKHNLPTYQQVTDGYSDEESESFLWKDGRRKRNLYQWLARLPQWVICGFIAMFFLLCFMMLLYGGAQPLQNVTISIEDVLASDKELIFDLRVAAYNPNAWTVHVADAEMNVFAFSRVMLSKVNETSSNLEYSFDSDPAEHLGTFHHFDEPLAFPSSMFSNKLSQTVSQIRIKFPGNDQHGNERWSSMIRYSYGLLARGVLSYHSLRLPGVHSQLVTICDVAQVDPITGVVSDYPNQGFCSLKYQ